MSVELIGHIINSGVVRIVSKVLLKTIVLNFVVVALYGVTTLTLTKLPLNFSRNLTQNLGYLAVMILICVYSYVSSKGNFQERVWFWGKPDSIVVWISILIGITILSFDRWAQMVQLSKMIFDPSKSMALSLVVLGPIREEFLWRGFVLRQLTNHTGYWQALAVSAVLFGLVHLHISTRAALSATIVGFMLGHTYHSSGRLSVAILFHMWFNLVVKKALPL